MSGQADIRKWFSKGKGKPEAPKKEEVVKNDTEGFPTAAGSGSATLKACSSKRTSDTKSAARPLQQEKASGDIAVTEKPPAMQTKRKKAAKAVVTEDGDDEDYEEDDEEYNDADDVSEGRAKKKARAHSIPSPAKEPHKGQAEGAGRGQGSAPGRGAAAHGRGGRGGGGGGRGAFWMEPKAPPPHKGEKEVPEGPEDALSGITFVITGTLDSLEREEAEDLIKRHGGRVTGSVSKKTTYLLTEEESPDTSKARKARELGVKTLKEDGLFDLIRAKVKASNAPGKQPSVAPSSSPLKPPQKLPAGGAAQGPAKTSLAARVEKTLEAAASAGRARATSQLSASAARAESAPLETESWPQKYAPKSFADVVGNQSLVKQLHDWLRHWHDVYGAGTGGQASSKKGKGLAAEGLDKKAVMLSGPPGIGKTTSARLVAMDLGLTAVEVNASDSRGKSDSKIRNGMGGSTANAIKEMVSNASLDFHADTGSVGKGKKQAAYPSSCLKDRSVLIMDEVDGMSGGDRGGVADLIQSIKASKVPIICICNDRYSQKLKSLINYCFCLNFRKPTKQQMAKRLKFIANKEGIQIPENALEEVGERVNGDMRMALNQLQYMSLSSTNLSYMDVRNRLQSSAKDEDIRPMAACDTLLGFAASRLSLDRLMDAAMSDIDIMPLMVQENFLNHVPGFAASDPSGQHLMQRVSAAADAIASGDIVNVQVRRYQQWQHLQFAAFMGCITPGYLMHGRRVTLEPGERNFERFPGWLGKNSSTGKNIRLLDDLRSHMVASKATASPSWQTVRMDYLETLERSILFPLKSGDPDTGVQEAADLMESYSLTTEDLDTATAVCKFKGRPDMASGIAPAVKGKLTRELKRRIQDSKAKASDFLPPVALHGKGKAVPAAFRQKKGAAKKKGSTTGAWLDTSAIQADPDMPVAVEEGAGLQGDEDEGDEDAGQNWEVDEDEDDNVRQRLLGAQAPGGSKQGGRGASRGRGRQSGTRGRGRGKRARE